MNICGKNRQLLVATKRYEKAENAPERYEAGTRTTTF
jgi:hypothetical protein